MRPIRPIFASKNSAVTPRSSDSSGPELPNQCCAARPSAGENWIARFGHLLDKAPSRQFNILYDSLVNAIRDEIPETVERIWAKAVSVETSAERQRITLANDETISARLVVLANGLNVGLRHQLGITRNIVSACHSISIGFDVVPARAEFVRLPGADLFLGAAERPHPLHHAVSDRHADARQSVRLPRLRRSLAARAAPRAGRDAGCRPAAAQAHHRRLRHSPAS